MTLMSKVRKAAFSDFNLITVKSVDDSRSGDFTEQGFINTREFCFAAVFFYLACAATMCSQQRPSLIIADRVQRLDI